MLTLRVIVKVSWHVTLYILVERYQVLWMDESISLVFSVEDRYREVGGSKVKISL
jgi:hypothetical protein